ncbi:hypothetical protein [Nocardiopsis sp. LOL_012]|uniref:hypothetical protein n=1 Tax=Nocardiopsis sp. LOL_012 TaxID=3345409 RepID=UPI003A892AFD
MGYLNIYRDDLEALMRAMKDFGGDSVDATVNRIANLTEPEDFSELPPDVPEKLESVVIKAANKSSEVTLNLGEARYHGEGACSIEIISPDQRSHGLRAQVEDICRPRRKRLAAEAREHVSVAIFVLFVVLAMGAFFLPYPDMEYAVLIRGVGAIGISFWPCLFIWKIASRHWKTSIINEYRAQRPTHWERHRITYISNAVSITVSLVLGGIIGYFVNQIS